LGGRKARFTPSDRAVPAALLHRFRPPTLRRMQLLAGPDTVLRWHRDLSKGRHAARSKPKRLREFEAFHNTHRPHQGIANARPLRPLPPPITDPDRPLPRSPRASKHRANTARQRNWAPSKHRECPGQEASLRAPPGTRTPNPRIKRPTALVSDQRSPCLSMTVSRGNSRSIIARRTIRRGPPVTEKADRAVEHSPVGRALHRTHRPTVCRPAIGPADVSAMRRRNTASTGILVVLPAERVVVSHGSP
jgi:hypothetical protein